MTPDTADPASAAARTGSGDAVCLIQAPAQADFLLDAIKALAAEEIRADTLENIQLTLAASGWRATAALLTHAARCADAGDFLAAERNRQLGREQFLTANDAWRQFMEARGTEARAKAFAEVFQ
jgi:hypothetical protein